MEDGDHPKEIMDISTITRLGEGVLGTGRLSDAAMERTTRVLESYRAILDRDSVGSVRCFGTSAVREAANRAAFIAMARDRAGMDVEVFSAYQEAYYTYLSVRNDPAIQGGNLVIIDIGGGSTEIIRGTRDAFADYVSVPVGTVKLTELFIAHDPPLPEELERLSAYVRDRIEGAVHEGGAAVVGMAGTMTTLAAMVLGIPFDKEKVHGMTISAALLDEWIGRLARMTVAERKLLPGMEAGREDLLLQGMLLMREIMAACGAGAFSVSTYGARYGVIYEATGRG
jgi:exopolyphosphatase/guanosine-5'-triphosphate,3'-diphosphate pyrophosphatase